MILKPLPTSTHTFRKIVEGGYLYVDKTPYLYELIHQASGMYFLSRPRRFGKSLLISTLDEIFRNNRELFKGLWLYDSDYHWQSYPVVRFDFSLRTVKTAEQLEKTLQEYLEYIAQDYNLVLQGDDYQSQFQNLIHQLAQQKPVVILIDEYDKPLLDVIEDPTEAARIREVLRGFYTIIKAMDAKLRFVFLTGISRFSRVGVFSGLNNLRDISLDNRFSALPGINQQELELFFAEHLRHFAQQEAITVDDLLKKIRHWYNGYRFSRRGDNVYTPFSLVQLLDTLEFRNFWFESGTPTFLIKLIQHYQYDIRELDRLELSELDFSSYELEDLRLVPLLFQTGYLTIKSYDPEKNLYRLTYPNHEVEDAFLSRLLNTFSSLQQEFNTNHLWRLVDALKAGDLDTFFDVLKIFFAQIPYDIQLKQEKYYQSLFYLIFRLIGLRIAVEQRTQQGRIDTVVELSDRVYLFEFKIDSSAEAALQQIKEKNYAEGFRADGKTLYLVGVNFDSHQRSVSQWLVET